MKKIILFLVVVIAFNGFCQEKFTIADFGVQCVDVNSISQKEKRGWKFYSDKFEGVTYIQRKDAHHLKIYPYIGVKDGFMYMRFITEYVGSDWVFYNKIIFLVDGERIVFLPTTPDRKVLDGVVMVSEKADTYVDEQTFLLLNKIANSKDKVEYRFVGNSEGDRKLKAKELETIRETLALYRRLILSE